MTLFKVWFERASDNCRDEDTYVIYADDYLSAKKMAKEYGNKHYPNWNVFCTEVTFDKHGFALIAFCWR